MNNNNEENNKQDRTCIRCGKEFRFPSQLERHLKNKIQCKIKSQNYICEHCNKPYSNKYNLINHTKICKIKINNENQNNNLQNNLQNNLNNNLHNNVNLDVLLEMINNVNNILNLFVKNNGQQANALPANIANLLQAHNSNINVDASNNQVANTNNNNIIINNIQNNINANITEDMIYPFGYEDIKFIPKEEMIQILKSPIGAQLALERTYSKLENTNFYKRNSNKDVITTIAKDMTIKVDNSQDFTNKIANNGTLLMERMLLECDSNLDFKDKMSILANIEEIKKSLKFQVNLEGILRFLEGHYQSDASKAIIKKFLKSLVSNPIKQRKINIAKEMIKELENFNEQLASGKITEEFLKEEVWSKKIVQNKDKLENHENHFLNNLNLRYYKETPRYKFYKKMEEEEYNYFQVNGLSVANVYKYRKILLKRANNELNRICAEYNEIIYDDAKNALITEPNNNLLNSVVSARLTNTIDDSHNQIENYEGDMPNDNYDDDNDESNSSDSTENSRLHDFSDVSSIDNDELDRMNHDRLLEIDCI
jgi:hypothetical protein